MKVTEYQWKSFDGYKLYAARWDADEPPAVAVVAFVHGHGDHCRRYDEWFAQLTDRHISVLSFDYRGHGRSEGKRGVIRKYEDLLKDVSLLHEKAKTLFPDIPVVLYGHSMGATIVLSYILRSPARPDLAIATSPWVQLKKRTKKWLSLFIRIGNFIAPYYTFKTGLHSSDFSTIDDFSEKREKDEYVHNRMSARLFSEVEQETIWIQAHFAEIKTPLLLMQGRDDKIMKITATRNLKDLAHGQVNYREWEYAGHQLHHSERSSEVMEYLVDWIKHGI